MKIIKSILVLISSVFLLLFLLLLFDMADYDSSYVNRKALVLDVKNLNSRYSLNTISFLRKNFLIYATKISKKYKEKWSIESEEKRLKYPEYKIISGKTANFSKSINTSEDYKNYSDWLRSNGNNYSVRFSALKNINKQNVKKLELAWTYKSNESLGREIQANPVVENGFIYTPTPGNYIVCINGKNGQEVWRYKVENDRAAKRGLLIWKNSSDKFSRIFFTDNESKLISLNAKTGKKIKSFGNEGEINIGISPIAPLIIDNYLIVATFKQDLQVYDVLSGKLLWKYYLHESKNSFLFANFKGGYPWGGISADNNRGIVFLTTGNPWPLFNGVDRSGSNLYANSIIAVDIRNKKKLWHFQEVSHDIWNLDIGATPILTTIKKDNISIDVVIALTKLGNTIILDRVTGETIFDFVKKRAPTSKIPGERTAIYQPDVKLPEPICRNQFKKEYITNIGKKNYNYILSIVENANFGFFKPHEFGKKNIIIGKCVRWAGASVDPDINRMYVSADIKADIIEIKLSTDDKFSFYGGYTPLIDLDGYPGIKPPWGTLTSMNLNNGKIVWQVPLGEHESLTKKGVPITGTSNKSGATATAGGLVFVSGTTDKKIRAFNSANGEELWSYKLPFIGTAPPTSYMIDGKQYIIIPAFDFLNKGDKLLSFSIK